MAPPPPPAVNRAPVANAGADATGMTGETLNLSATASSDPDADTLTYSWAIASGPPGGTLTNATQATANFQAAAAGTYVLEVTVRDPGQSSSVDSLSLTIASPPAPPAFGISGLPAHVVQGEVSTIAIHLPAPAGAGGVRVTLLSSNPAAIEVPASIDVMEGDTLVSFNVDASRDGHRHHYRHGAGRKPGDPRRQRRTGCARYGGVERRCRRHGRRHSGHRGHFAGTSSSGRRARLIDALECGACVARCDYNSIFAPGSTTANTTLTALAPGAVEVSATLDGTHSTERVRLGGDPGRGFGDSHQRVPHRRETRRRADHGRAGTGVSRARDLRRRGVARGIPRQ